MSIEIILIAIAAILAILALCGVVSRVNLTAAAILLVCIALVVNGVK
jgi:NADH:ubiquinone oxidoreductase subunit 6 (subunit J)